MLLLIKFKLKYVSKAKMVQYKNYLTNKILDLAGPIELCFVNYSSLIVVYFLKQKGNKFLVIKKYWTSIKCLRSNIGTKFNSENFEILLINNHINMRNQPHTLHTKQHCRKILVIYLKWGKQILVESKLPKFLWLCYYDNCIHQKLVLQSKNWKNCL